MLHTGPSKSSRIHRAPVDHLGQVSGGHDAYSRAMVPHGAVEPGASLLDVDGHRLAVDGDGVLDDGLKPKKFGPDGKERKKSFPDRAKREAEAFMVSTETDKLRGSYVDPPVALTLPWENPADEERVTVPLLFTTTRRGAISRHLRRQELAPRRPRGRHHADPCHRHARAAPLLRLVAARRGESIKALASYLGHADPGFTLRVYTHLMPASEERTRRVIDDLFTDQRVASIPGTVGRQSSQSHHNPSGQTR